MNAAPVTAPGAMPARPPKGVARHAWKYKAPTERRDRSRVAWIAGIAFLFFMGCAVAGVLTRQTWAPVPFGTIWIELAMEYFPQAWFLGPLHNLVLAGVAAGFFFMVTTAHVDTEAG